MRSSKRQVWYLHIFVVGLLVARVPATMAADWQQAAVDANGTKAYVAANTLRTAGAFRRAWVMWELAGVARSDKGETIKSYKTLWTSDCVANTFTWSQTYVYSGLRGSGELIQFAEGSTRPRDVPPDTWEEGIAKFICLGR